MIIDEEIINGEHEDDIETRSLIVNSDYFQTEHGEALVEDCKSIIVEKTFESHWALLEGYHALGERIINDSGFQKYAKSNNSCLQSLAKNLSISERTLYYSMQFYQKYPDINLVEGGKSATWTKVVKNLPQGEHPHKKSLKDVLIAIKELLKHDWEDNNKLFIETGDMEAKDKADYIRYLQDQIAKLEA